MKNKKILIVGNLYALAQKLSKEVEKVFVAPGNSMISEFAESVDIREDKPAELLEFAFENDIDLTIVASEKAIASDIAGIFQANEKLIFAPSAESASFAINKSQGKRFLYKLHAPTPKFGNFEKLPLAIDYLKEANYPLVVRSDVNENGLDRLCCINFERAKYFVEDLFSQNLEKVVIEEYAYGHEFTMYFVTDGYLVLPLTTVSNYKFTENGDGGYLTSGVGAYVPAYKVPEEIQQKVFKNVVINAINALEKKGTPYLGILGIDVVMTSPDTYTVLEFKPFMQDFDAQAVLNSIDEDLIDLFEACANGFFADEYEDVLLNDNVSVSCVVKSRKDDVVIPNIDLVESSVAFINAKKNKYFEYIAYKGDVLVLTATAKTLTRAKEILKEDLELIKFDGMKYRSDIC